MMGQMLEREKPSNVTLQHRICLYGRYELNNDGLYQYKEYDGSVVTPTNIINYLTVMNTFLAMTINIIDSISILIILLVIIPQHN